jgi:hypothetical protein
MRETDGMPVRTSSRTALARTNASSRAIVHTPVTYREGDPPTA